MLFKELTREEDLEISRLDGYDAGYTKGEQAGAERGAAQEKREIAKEMKRENIAQDVIAKVTGLNVEEIEALYQIASRQERRISQTHNEETLIA